jgi:PD-(D/E)XK nuclease superfamily protein
MEGERLTPSRKGAIAEAEITAEAARLGMDVYRPVVEGCRCDLILGLGRRLLRIQCKWSRRHGDVIRVMIRTNRHTPNGYVHTKYTADEIDAVMAYCPDLGQCYFLPISMVAGRNCVYLRLAPTKNRQVAGIQWANRYEFPGAIAQLGERLDGIEEAAGSSPASSTQLRVPK